jgi:hypothetical protein
MSIVAAISSVQTPSTGEMVLLGGALATTSLIISLITAIMISDSKYWDKWARSTIDASSASLLITFAVIVVFKIQSLF